MSPTITYRVDGLGSLAYKLRTADEKIRAEGISAVRRATRLVYRTAVEDAPYRFGDLIRSMFFDVTRPRTVRGFLRHRYEGVVGFDTSVTKHGPFQEVGTGIHGPFRRPYAVFTGSGRSYRFTPAGGGGLGYYLHPGVPALHFVRDAGIKQDAAVHLIFKRTGRRIAKRIASGV